MPDSTERRSFISPAIFEKALGVVLVLNLFDAFATLFWVHSGLATEANPVMASALAGGVASFLLSKVALVTLATALLWRLRDQRFARLAVIPVGLLYSLVAGGHVGFGMLTGAVALL